MNRIGCLLAVVIVLPVAAAKAGVVTIYPSDAVTVLLDLTKPVDDPLYFVPQVGPNAGTTIDTAGYVPWSIYRAMLKFDLSGIPNGATVSSARLRMHAYTFGGPLAQPEVQSAQRMSFDAWNDTMVDDSGYIGSVFTDLGSTVLTVGDDNIYTWNLNTALWDFAADLADDAVTLQVRFVSEGDFYYRFSSYFNYTTDMPPGAVWADEHWWPRLEVTVVPEPTTLSLLGLGLAGLIARPRRRRAQGAD